MTRVAAQGPETLRAFRVGRDGRGPLLVLWDQRDAFYGEDAPPVTVIWPWPGDSATVTAAFGAVSRVPADDGRLRLRVSATPLFVEEQAAQDQAAQDQARQRNGAPPL